MRVTRVTTGADGESRFEEADTPLRHAGAIAVGTGEARRFSGGDVLPAEGTTGRGHRSRPVDGRKRRSLFIPLDESSQLGTPGR